MSSTSNPRVLSGMRATGKLHLGHYHGVLKNWVKLQHEYECLFFVADWHGLTTEYRSPDIIANSVWPMVVDWLACGIDPGLAHVFIQSQVPEIAELHLLLSMITPMSWLERIPSYKDQQEKLKEKHLNTYGFLGYPLLQSADVLIYKANYVPVGEDQLAHIEMTRELARHFNHLYGCEPDFIVKAEAAIDKLGRKNANFYRELKNRFQERGDHEALEVAKALLEDQQGVSLSDKERLFGYLEGIGKIILPEPEALVTETAKFPGLDGQKMSKSYHNTIGLGEKPEVIEQKIRTMPTDPARVRRSDPGEPEKCPVWAFHKVYSPEDVKSWVQEGCRTAGIGCLDCKMPVIHAIQKEQEPIRIEAEKYANDPALVKTLVSQGGESAREIARDTLEEVKSAMGLEY
jgi:tryptophanyl-tRNA synthetase